VNKVDERKGYVYWNILLKQPPFIVPVSMSTKYRIPHVYVSGQKFQIITVHYDRAAAQKKKDNSVETVLADLLCCLNICDAAMELFLASPGIFWKIFHNER
jgi:hypothetical protein